MSSSLIIFDDVVQYLSPLSNPPSVRRLSYSIVSLNVAFTICSTLSALIVHLPFIVYVPGPAFFAASISSSFHTTELISSVVLSLYLTVTLDGVSSSAALLFSTVTSSAFALRALLVVFAPVLMYL